MNRLWLRLRDRIRARHNVRSHLWQSLTNYLQQGFGLVLTFVLARLLSPDEFGLFAYSAVTVFLCFLPASWSLNTLLLLDGGRDADLYRKVLGSSWLIAGTKAVILIGAVLWLASTHSWHAAMLAIAVGAPEALRELVNVNKAWLEGSGNYKPNFLSAVMSTTLTVAVTIPLAMLGGGASVLAIPAILALCTDYFVFRHFGRKEWHAPPDWRFLRAEAGSGFWIWVNAVSDLGIFRIDKWLVGNRFGMETLGHYSRAFNFAPLSHTILGSFIANPTVSALSRAANLASQRRIFLKTAWIVLLGNAANWAVWLFFAPDLVPFLFGDQWYDAVPYFQLFATLGLCYALYYLPGTAMTALKRYRELALVRAGALAVLLLWIAFTNEDLSPQRISIALQTIVAAQGIFLTARVLHLLAHNLSQSSTSAERGLKLD